jgi:hypothetical protein
MRDEGRPSGRYKAERTAIADISCTRFVNLAKKKKITRTKEKTQNETALFFILEIQGH